MDIGLTVLYVVYVKYVPHIVEVRTLEADSVVEITYTLISLMMNPYNHF